MADDQKRYSESEIRGQITARQKEVEEIAFRCERQGFKSTAFALTEALKWMADAKVRAAGEEAD